MAVTNETELSPLSVPPQTTVVPPNTTVTPSYNEINSVTVTASLCSKLHPESGEKSHSQAHEKENDSECTMYQCPSCGVWLDEEMFQSHHLGGKCTQEEASPNTQHQMTKCKHCSLYFAGFDLNSHETICKMEKNKEQARSPQATVVLHCPVCSEVVDPSEYTQHIMDCEEKCTVEDSLESFQNDTLIKQPPIVLCCPVCYKVIDPKEYTQHTRDCEERGVTVDSTESSQNSIPLEQESTEVCMNASVLNMNNENEVPGLCREGNILVIKPENETDVDMPCTDRNVLIIKPKNESTSPEQCKDDCFLGLNSETEAKESSGNSSDSSTFSLKPEPNVMNWDKVMDKQNSADINENTVVKCEDCHSGEQLVMETSRDCRIHFSKANEYQTLYPVVNLLDISKVSAFKLESGCMDKHKDGKINELDRSKEQYWVQVKKCTLCDCWIIGEDALEIHQSMHPSCTSIR